MNLANIVKQRREQLGMSQEELALKMGYKSRSSVNKIENGRPVTQKIIVRLAEALQTTPAHLMGWEQEEIDSIASVQDESMGNWKLLITDRTRWNASQTRWMEEIGTMDFSDDELQQIMDFTKYLLSKRKQ